MFNKLSVLKETGVKLGNSFRDIENTQLTANGRRVPVSTFRPYLDPEAKDVFPPHDGEAMVMAATDEFDVQIPLRLGRGLIRLINLYTDLQVRHSSNPEATTRTLVACQKVADSIQENLLQPDMVRRQEQMDIDVATSDDAVLFATH
jgi:hypothetical protein